MWLVQISSEPRSSRSWRRGWNIFKETSKKSSCFCIALKILPFFSVDHYFKYFNWLSRLPLKLDQYANRERMRSCTVAQLGFCVRYKDKWVMCRTVDNFPLWTLTVKLWTTTPRCHKVLHLSQIKLYGLLSKDWEVALRQQRLRRLHQAACRTGKSRNTNAQWTNIRWLKKTYNLEKYNREAYQYDVGCPFLTVLNWAVESDFSGYHLGSDFPGQVIVSQQLQSTYGGRVVLATCVVTLKECQRRNISTPVPQRQITPFFYSGC